MYQYYFVTYSYFNGRETIFRTVRVWKPTDDINEVREAAMKILPERLPYHSHFMIIHIEPEHRIVGVPL
jgi:hypothetical protein